METVQPCQHHTDTTKDKVYVRGKFLYTGNEKLYLKGVTYGTFAPLADGSQYPEPTLVEKDFAMMAHNGINCIRTYTVPPLYLLDLAFQYHLKIMIGLPWEQQVTFLDETNRKRDILKRVKEGVESCRKHPAILCYAIGNEIPASIVRWHGKKKIEAFLKDLYKTVKQTDPDRLVTYVNFPTTEYLDLGFLDFYCFNVYLETPEKLSAYLARLHNLSGDRPLVLAEIGFDSFRNGTDLQAKTLAWQVTTVFAKGGAGLFIFAWTDEWWRGGADIEDWDFGLVDRQRNSKPALKAVREAMAEIPVLPSNKFPFISVVVCSYNGAATIRDTMEGLQKLTYPAYEVIVVNDGSEDNLAAIVQEYPVKLINTKNRGLASARNTGLYAAGGEIIAYIDDDAYPDIHWLHYLAQAYLHTDFAGIGGPNIIPEEDGPIAHCVANAPGGPVHVLLTDETAEHIPGCNMSFRKEVLLEAGGFDPVYRAAGDDVDICWKIQKRGYAIGFHPAAVVWHHRRNSVKAYWKQQKGYGKAEALLEEKWPEKYNRFGHLTWSGRIYGTGFTLPIRFKKEKVFHGTWGTALFQSVYQPANGFLSYFPLMPEWYLFAALLALFSLLGLLWNPLLWFFPFFLASILITIIQATLSAVKNVSLQAARQRNIKYTLLITFLHAIQPVARLYGRLTHGLTPLKKREADLNFRFRFLLRTPILSYWSMEWRAAEDWLLDMEKELIFLKARVKRGGDFDRWDMQVSNSLFSTCRGLLAIEEHGGHQQLLRFKVRSFPSLTIVVTTMILAAILTLAAIDGAWTIVLTLGIIITGIIIEYIRDAIHNVSNFYTAFKSLEKKIEEPAKKEKIKPAEDFKVQPEYFSPALPDAELVIENALIKPARKSKP